MTSSLIGFEDGSGRIEAIFCATEGDLEHQIPLLLGHFPLMSNVKELMKLGSIQVLGKNANLSPILHPHEDKRTYTRWADIVRAQGIGNSKYVYILTNGRWWFREHDATRSSVQQWLRCELTEFANGIHPPGHHMENLE